MFTREILEEFKLECELRRLTPRTIKGYYNSSLQFLTWLEKQQGIIELEEIRTTHIKMYMQYLIKKNLSPSYINSVLRCIRAYFRYAVEEDYLRLNPAEKINWQPWQLPGKSDPGTASLRISGNCHRDYDYRSAKEPHPGQKTSIILPMYPHRMRLGILLYISMYTEITCNTP